MIRLSASAFKRALFLTVLLGSFLHIAIVVSLAHRLKSWSDDKGWVWGEGLDDFFSTKPSWKVVGTSDDNECPFRNSSIYRKVFVYPTYGDVENGWSGSILSEAARRGDVDPWPWLEYDRISRLSESVHYNPEGPNAQFATEILVRELLTNPRSCLRTMDPSKATLFYVPYMPSIELRESSDEPIKEYFRFSPYGDALLDILQLNDYDGWEKRFGLTSTYWKRRGGADHLIVMGEPFAGLFHAAEPRGNYRYIETHQHLSKAIIVSTELSATFIQMYPKCATKNILVPYPNVDGRWMNGQFQREASNLLIDAKPYPNIDGKSFLGGMNVSHQPADVTLVTRKSVAALRSERKAARAGDTSVRPVAQFYEAGEHGYCGGLRRSLNWDYSKCSQSRQYLHKRRSERYEHSMRLSTFCPAPCGDSPSAKRMFDACLAECIPVVISEDFVWPFTKSFDPSFELDGSDFSLRYPGRDFEEARLESSTCRLWDKSKPSLEARLETIPQLEISRLRQGLKRASELYSWYKPNPRLGTNPLRERILPDGGAAHMLVRELEKRAGGVRWPACQEELKLPRGKEPEEFKI